MAALAGALRRYPGVRRRAAPARWTFAGVVPVNLRRPEAAGRLGNRFGLVFLSLPVGIEDPLDRLFEVRRRMRALKDSPQALAVYQVLWAMGAAPRPLFDLALRIFAAKGTAVVTNVVGPRQTDLHRRRAAASRPCSGSRAPAAWRSGVSLLSYAGKVWMGLQCDAAIVPDPDGLLDGFDAEVEALLELCRQAGS